MINWSFRPFSSNPSANEFEQLNEEIASREAKRSGIVGFFPYLRHLVRSLDLYENSRAFLGYVAFEKRILRDKMLRNTRVVPRDEKTRHYGKGNIG